MKTFRKMMAWGIFWFLCFDGLALAVGVMRFTDSISRDTFFLLMRVSDYSMVGVILCLIALMATYVKKAIEQI